MPMPVTVLLWGQQSCHLCPWKLLQGSQGGEWVWVGQSPCCISKHFTDGGYDFMLESLFIFR